MAYAGMPRENWYCERCTFENPPQAQLCDMCGYRKPPPQEAMPRPYAPDPVNNWRAGLNANTIASISAYDRNTYKGMLVEAISATESGEVVEPPTFGKYGGNKPIYVYLGHGREELIPIPGTNRSTTNKTHVVPEGCTYSTLSETGKHTLMGSIFAINSMFNHPGEKLYFYDPITNFTNITIKLKRKFNNTVFHVSDQGENYTNSYCDFLLGFPDDNGHRVYKSGIYDLSGRGPHPHLSDGNEGKFTIPPEGADLDVVRAIYDGSIFPTADEVIALLQKRIILAELTGESFAPNGKITYANLSRALYDLLLEKGYTKQSDIFEKNLLPPGNHYYNACRSFLDDTLIEPTTLTLLRHLSNNRSRALGGNNLRKEEKDLEKELEKQERLLSEFNELKIQNNLYASYLRLIDSKPHEYLIRVSLEKEKINKNILLLKEFIARGLDTSKLLNEIKKTLIYFKEKGLTNLQVGGKRTRKNRKKNKKTRKNPKRV